MEFKKAFVFNTRVQTIIFSGLFLCGALSGIFSAGGASYLSFEDYLTSHGSISYIASLFNVIKYPALLFSLGLCGLGVGAIPIVVFAKGFSLGFSVSAVFCSLGAKGFFLAVALFGISAVFTIPCVISSAIIAFRASYGFARAMCARPLPNASLVPKGYFFIFGIIAVTSLIGSLADFFLTPRILSLVVTLF